MTAYDKLNVPPMDDNSEGIGARAFPPSGPFLGRRVRVCFNYDTSIVIGGSVVRDDAAEPGHLIIALDDGRYVLSTECQYGLVRDGETPPNQAPGSGAN